MKKYIKVIISVLSVAVCSLLVFTSLENKTADVFQRLLPSLKESPRVVMINVNDVSIENIGTWPFSRDVYAKTLVVLKNLGVKSCVFDLSFLDKSPAKVDETYVKETLPSYVEENFSILESAVNDAIEAVSDGGSSLDDAKDYVGQTARTVRNTLDTSISYVIRSQDALLSDALTFFDTAYLTLTADNELKTSDETSEYLKNYIALKNVTSIDDTLTKEYDSALPAIHELLIRCKGAGFVNAPPDRDGYLRRLPLLLKIDGHYYGQLMFVPLLEYFGNPDVEVSNSQIVLKDAKLSDGTVKDIVIPRDRNGSVIVKYPKKLYSDYNGTSLWNVYRLSLLEDELFNCISEMQQNGILDLWPQDAVEFYNSAKYLEEALYGGENPEEGITYELYSQYRDFYLNAVKEILNSDYENILKELYEYDDDTVSYIAETFEYGREIFNEYDSSFSNMKNLLKGTFCILGTNATSTTDYGLTQYEENYPNPGVHYTIANQILAGDFVDDSPLYITVLIALAFTLIYGFISSKMESIGRQIVLGLSTFILALAVLIIVFVTLRIYLGGAVPLLSLIVAFVGITVFNLLTTSKDKKFIKSAFSQCLAPAVVEQIVKNPSSFKLGGQNIDMTAIFTDIQKFSGFSELLSASQLVALLNFYLTRMSDIIMDFGGTVDKYEGDAIVAFVGAPIQTKEHASLACRAAVNMKKAESEMNAYIEQVASSSKPEQMEDDLYQAFCIMIKNGKKIFTRIGLNSGDIVAGYMGSTNKKNYTVMGNNVNLASRLEGVNKQYRTGGILMSEATRKNLDQNFIVRSLDRVQVVNVVTPIRLYELIDLRENADEELIKYVENWEKVMKVFESGNYSLALDYFKKLHKLRPDDNVAGYYIELIEKFFINGKFPTENDDFGVAYNSTNPDGMNPKWVGTPFEIKGTFKLLQK